MNTCLLARVAVTAVVMGLVVVACSGADTPAAPCPDGQQICEGACVDTLTDQDHCGSCVQACGGGLTCVQGACTSSGCQAGERSCGGQCVDPLTDPAHCGDCGMACNTGDVCVAGQCATECPGGTERCGSACVDTATDSMHCGSCDTPCAAPSSCVGGICGMGMPCGDGTLDANEECDDGNTTSGDGCDATCAVECGVDGIENPTTHHCYRLSKGVDSWDTARAACMQLGTGWDLAGLSDQAERDFIDDVVNAPSDTFLGGSNQNGNWVWVNGETWGYAPWDVGEPNGSGTCVRLWEILGNSNDVLRDSACVSPYPYLCELIPAGSSASN